MAPLFGALNLAARSRFYERVAPVNTLAGALAYRRAPGGPGDSTPEVGLVDHTPELTASDADDDAVDQPVECGPATVSI